ncbi:hypothetical protein [Bradyrhizobium sp. LB11.1]|uniref:hypothetical protein n=1 Tax=Bradyrhizobium sp. LB11.1 TaxID=3156326 RepID=UPI0033948F9A
MITRRKRAAEAVTEAESAAEAAFLDMGRVEAEWLKAKIRYHYSDQEACKKELRRARGAFRKAMKVCILATWDAERINEELDRKRDRKRERERLRLDQQMHGLHRSDLTGHHAGRFQRWGHGDDMGVA